MRNPRREARGYSTSINKAKNKKAKIFEVIADELWLQYSRGKRFIGSKLIPTRRDWAYDRPVKCEHCKATIPREEAGCNRYFTRWPHTYICKDTRNCRRRRRKIRRG